MRNLSGLATPLVLVVADHPVVAATWALVLFPLAWFTGIGALVYSGRRQRRKGCPECAERVRADAVRCPFCGHHFARRW
jgi:hypothetical protein